MKLLESKQNISHVFLMRNTLFTDIGCRWSHCTGSNNPWNRDGY